MSKRERKLLHKQIMARAEMQEMLEKALASVPQQTKEFVVSPTKAAPLFDWWTLPEAALGLLSLIGMPLVVIVGLALTIPCFIVALVILWFMIAVPLGLA